MDPTQMTHANDTICALSTPPGVGGIAVVRVSGPDAVAVAQRLWRGRQLDQVATHTAHLGTLCDSDGRPLDQAVATVFRAPRSFTGEDVVELSVHGSLYIQQQLVNSLIDAGARLADPGEFTRRAFTAGRMDLAQAEAVADLIASQSRAAHRIAVNQMRGSYSQRLAALRSRLIDLASLLELELDFSEEDVEFASRQQLRATAVEVKAEVDRLAASFSGGAAIKHGIPVAIVGVTNAGKSSLLNALLGDDRAIVSDVHGTTRDIVEDTLTLGDYTFRLMDTAGLRDTSDSIERLGIERSLAAAHRASILIVVIDGADPQLPQLPDTQAKPLVVVNKTDLEPSDRLDAVLASPQLVGAPVVRISARGGQGIDALADRMQRIADSYADSQDVMVTNARHYEALSHASQSIARVIDAIDASLTGDLIAMDIRLTISHLSSILGDITSTDLLTTIFSRFCIGK